MRMVNTYLVNICAETELFLVNTFLHHKMIHRYTWRRRDERSKQRSMTDYIALDERLRKDVLNAKVVRGMFEGSDHYTVLAKIRIRGTWEYRSKVKRKVNKVLATKGMDRKEVRVVYERKVCERLTEARTSIGEEASVNVFHVFKPVVNAVAAELVTYRVLKGGRKGRVWWTDKIMEVIERKKGHIEKCCKRMCHRRLK